MLIYDLNSELSTILQLNRFYLKLPIILECYNCFYQQLLCFKPEIFHFIILVRKFLD